MKRLVDQDGFGTPFRWGMRAAAKGWSPPFRCPAGLLWIGREAWLASRATRGTIQGEGQAVDDPAMPDPERLEELSPSYSIISGR